MTDDNPTTWRGRATDAADRAFKAEKQVHHLVGVLQKIVHTGYKDDAWVALAQKALDSYKSI